MLSILPLVNLCSYYKRKLLMTRRVFCKMCPHQTVSKLENEVLKENSKNNINNIKTLITKEAQQIEQINQI